MGDAVTLADVSERAGVAPITCSRVLNGSKVRIYIAEKTRQRVLAAARELGYRRNMTARATRTGRVGAVGLLGITPNRVVPRALLLGAEEATASRDLHLIFSQLRHGEMDSEAHLPRILRETAVDGLLIFGMSELQADTRLARRIRQTNWPVIHLADAAAVDCIRLDASAASSSATEVLIRSGHQRIAFVQFASWPKQVGFDIREGYQRSMRDAGLPTRPLIEPDLRQRVAGRHAFACEILQQPDRPTAIMASGRREAAAFVVAALGLGLRLPEDLAVSAVSDEHVEVGGLMVTTTQMSYGQLARTGVRMLCTKIDRPDRTLAPQVLRHRMLPGQTT